jgi:hypothetical protein
VGTTGPLAPAGTPFDTSLSQLSFFEAGFLLTLLTGGVVEEVVVVSDEDFSVETPADESEGDESFVVTFVTLVVFDTGSSFVVVVMFVSPSVVEVVEFVSEEEDLTVVVFWVVSVPLVEDTVSVPFLSTVVLVPLESVVTLVPLASKVVTFPEEELASEPVVALVSVLEGRVSLVLVELALPVVVLDESSETPVVSFFK